jgi:hypothetical protein
MVKLVPADVLNTYTGEYVMNDITLSIKRNGDHLSAILATSILLDSYYFIQFRL